MDNFPVALRMEAIRPVSLGGMLKHAERKGGDLDHCDADRLDKTIWYDEVAPRDFKEAVNEEIEAMSQANLDNALEAMLKNRRTADHDKRKEEGKKPPYRDAENGPLREVILTANAQYFYADPDDPDPYKAHRTTDKGDRETVYLSRDKIKAFEQRGLEFFAEYFPGQLRHLRLDMDEEVPHFHALIMVTKVTNSKRRGKQINIVPSANPLIKNYEWAQDAAGKFFSTIGLVRGERRAEARRDAKERDLPLPERRGHVSPAEFRAERAERIRQREELASERFEKAGKMLRRAEFEAEDMRLGAMFESDDIIADALEKRREADSTLASVTGVASGDIVFDPSVKDTPFTMGTRADPKKAKPLLDAISFAPKAAVEAAKSLVAAIAPLHKRLKAQLAAIKGVANAHLTVSSTAEGEDFQVADGADPQVAETLLRDIRLAPKSAMTVVMPLVKAMRRARNKENTAIAKSAAVLGAVKGLFGFQTVQSGDGFVPIDETDPELVARLTVHMNRDRGAATEIGRMTVDAIERKAEETAKAAVESAAVAEDRATEAEERWNTAYSQLAGIIKSAGKYMSPSDHKAFCKEASFTTSKAALSVNPVMSGRGKPQKGDERE